MRIHVILERPKGVIGSQTGTDPIVGLSPSSRMTDVTCESTPSRMTEESIVAWITKLSKINHNLS